MGNKPQPPAVPTTPAPEAAPTRSEFDQLLDGVQPTGGMFLAPTKAHDLPLKYIGMETATSQYAVDETNPDGIIKVLRCVRTDTDEECLLRLTSNRLLLAFQVARDEGGATFTKGTVFRILVSGSGTKTSYRIAVQKPLIAPAPNATQEPSRQHGEVRALHVGGKAGENDSAAELLAILTDMANEMALLEPGLTHEMALKRAREALAERAEFATGRSKTAIARSLLKELKTMGA